MKKISWRAYIRNLLISVLTILRKINRQERILLDFNCGFSKFYHVSENLVISFLLRLQYVARHKYCKMFDQFGYTIYKKGKEEPGT